MAMARYVRAALALSCIVVAPWAIWCFCPHLPSTCIARISEVLAGFNSWFTPWLLFLVMNAVVFTLAFTSGFIKQRPLSMLDGEECEDLSKIRRRANAEEEEEDEDDDEEEGDPLYPEVLSSIFGESITRRRPFVKHRVSAERKVRSFYPSLSYKVKPGSPGHSPVVNPTPRVLRHVHAPPQSATFDLEKPISASAASHGNGGDRDVDERADAFIGDFYKKMKLQQVDPHTERLERSYGR